MTVSFKINGQTRTGKVVDRGFFHVDGPECYEVEINSYGFTKLIPVCECEPV